MLPKHRENTLKIFGFAMNAKASMETHLSCVKSQIGFELSKLRPYLHLMNTKDRKIILNTKLRSIIDYGLPLFMGETEAVKSKIEGAYMLVNRIIHGQNKFMTSKTKICCEIKADLPKMWMKKRSHQLRLHHILVLVRL